MKFRAKKLSFLCTFKHLINFQRLSREMILLRTSSFIFKIVNTPSNAIILIYHAFYKLNFLTKMVMKCRRFRLLYQSRCWNLPLVLSIVLSVLFYMGVTFLCHSLRYYVTLGPSFTFVRPHPSLLFRQADKRIKFWWRRSSLVVRASGCQAEVPTVLGSIPASSDTVESEGRQMKQCWIQYIEKKKNPKKSPFEVLAWYFGSGSASPGLMDRDRVHETKIQSWAQSPLKRWSVEVRWTVE